MKLLCPYLLGVRFLILVQFYLDYNVILRMARACVGWTEQQHCAGASVFSSLFSLFFISQSKARMNTNDEISTSMFDTSCNADVVR